ncbi:MAG: biotin--[acetyl-CoA-carboxylase] ligase [Sulfuricurvum sp.]|uniref:biotin--[acetyl-CoA-carboxylase] ligase n=1 Tax=Sulfuricurvum sp. TaxID=2025608 RepID=UPI002625DAE5|nr:biotin--[acetyl-CoA-carboxylase] ligase [Sulfuricurvum sp.]MDD2829291.1 biotin--[acetyl-CoA-carboxylase] ligase [Sulfuricurvum sp.]MDD4948608.1 biotin--[acetyl-CoA-carboxylase] ligase [Sulfuricurvum sp.]
MEILWLDEVESTQTYLIDALKSGVLKIPICVGASRQSNGKGSRGNSWIGYEGNFFISFALSRASLPDDLKLESSSIYFAYILKEVLSNLGSSLWLKWPNDFYIGEKKVGGVITNLVGESLVCGIGLNLQNGSGDFGVMDIEIDSKDLSKLYITELKKFYSWKQTFSKYRIEFERSKSFSTHSNNRLIELKEAVLCEDGSLECNGQRIFSLR